MRFAIPAILILISVAGILMYTNPLFQDISQLKIQTASYDEALANAKLLEGERDKLTKKYNSIDPGSLAKLQKFLPDNVDNIRLILEIEKIASPYGMTLKEVKYDTFVKNSSTTVGAGDTGDDPAAASRKEYGSWDLGFSTEGTYDNFIALLKDLESNLRIIDISSIEFSSLDPVGAGSNGVNPPSKGIYKYNFKIKTYWLKN